MTDLPFEVRGRHADPYILLGALFLAAPILVAAFALSATEDPGVRLLFYALLFLSGAVILVLILQYVAWRKGATLRIDESRVELRRWPRRRAKTSWSDIAGIALRTVPSDPSQLLWIELQRRGEEPVKLSRPTFSEGQLQTMAAVLRAESSKRTIPLKAEPAPDARSLYEAVARQR